MRIVSSDGACARDDNGGATFESGGAITPVDCVCRTLEKALDDCASAGAGALSSVAFRNGARPLALSVLVDGRTTDATPPATSKATTMCKKNRDRPGARKFRPRPCAARVPGTNRREIRLGRITQSSGESAEWPAAKATLF